MSFESYILRPGFRLHVKTTKQFKTTTVRVFLTRNLDKNTTKAALLPYILRRGTKTYPNMTKISRHLENLYGTAIGTDVSKLGEWQVLSIFADVPNERFLPTKTPVLLRALEFIDELIFSPAGTDGFIQDYVSSEKDNVRKFILSLYEDRSSYAFKRLFDVMCEGEPFARYEYGDLKSLNLLRPSTLYKFYLSMRRSIPIDIYIVGDIDTDRLLKAAGKLFGSTRTARSKLSPPVIKKARRKPKASNEYMDVAQGRLLMGYRSSVAFNDPQSHTLAMASAVLGGFAHSKLFQNIREKASLAYSVGTYMSRSKGVMVAYAGIEPGTEGRVRTMIEKQFAELKSGRISSFELDSTKASILDDIAAINDVPGKEIDFHFVNSLHGVSATPREVGDKIASLTKSEIAKAAERLVLDTIYNLTKQKKMATGKNLELPVKA